MAQKYIYFLLALLVCGFFGLQAVEKTYPEAKQENRSIAAKAKLESGPDMVTIYAKGLCCPSCAIGIRKKVGKLDFVDTKRLKKGVELDAKMQLATVALKKGQSRMARTLGVCSSIWIEVYIEFYIDILVEYIHNSVCVK